MTPAQANLAAEARAVEEGHYARYDAARHAFVVRSDTSDRSYAVTAYGAPDLIAFSCDCPAGVHRHVPAGSVACKHQALVGRRLEREGLAHFDGGHWVVTDRAKAVAW